MIGPPPGRRWTLSTEASPHPASPGANSLSRAGGEALLRPKPPDCPLPDAAIHQYAHQRQALRSDLNKTEVSPRDHSQVERPLFRNESADRSSAAIKSGGHAPRKCCPGGTSENSPAFQRRGARKGILVPKGRPRRPLALSRPFGTDLLFRFADPALKRRAIFGSHSGAWRGRSNLLTPACLWR